MLRDVIVGLGLFSRQRANFKRRSKSNGTKPANSFRRIPRYREATPAGHPPVFSQCVEQRNAPGFLGEGIGAYQKSSEAARKTGRTTLRPGEIRQRIVSPAAVFALVIPVALSSPSARAADATWVGTTGVYNTAGNWNPNSVPGSSDTATFDSTGTTQNLTFSATANVGGWTFNNAASNYGFTSNKLIKFNGAGIVINGGSVTITINSNELDFLNSSTAGSATIINNNLVQFFNSSTAGSATITNNNEIDFVSTSTAGSATITNNKLIEFSGTSTAGSATITTENGATTVFTGTSSGGTAQLIANAGGVVDFSNLTSSGTTAGSFAGAGAFRLGSKALTVGGNNLSTTVTGTIEDGGSAGGVGAQLIKAGTGTLTLSGTNTYTGGTTISAGTLSVNGDISSSSGVTVESGGILGGTGTVSSTTINSGGALAPGNSIGTITVSGNLTFNSGSNYNVEFSSSTADRTNVSGTATLAGTVNASYQSGTSISKQYTILNATGGVSGTFSALANTNLPSNVSTALSYDANNVYLDLTLSYTTLGGLDTNQQNVSDVLTDYFNTTGSIPAAFTDLSSNGLSQIAGEPGAGVQQMVFTAADLFMNSVFGHAFGSVNGNGAGSTGQGGGALGYASRRKLPRKAREAFAAVTPRALATEIEKRWGVWAAGYGGHARVAGDSATGSHDTTSRVYGVAAGADYRVSSGTRLGFALGGAGSSFSLAGGFGSGKADVFNAAFYGRHAFGASYVAAALGYSWQDASTDRTVTASGTDVLHASFHPQALTARLEGGHRFETGMVGVTPYAGLQSTTFFMPSYSESATSGSNQFALTYDSRQVTATRGELGARFDKRIALADKVLTVKAKAAWAHDWNRDRNATATFQQLAGATFTVNGAKPAADSLLVSAGAALALGHGWTFAADFDGEFSGTTASYAGKGSVRWVW